MKFLALLLLLPFAAAGVTAIPKEELKTRSGKANARREIFTLSRTINLAAGGGPVRGMGSGINVPLTGKDLCGECTVLEGQIHLTNAADGSLVDEKVVYNHHILTNGPSIPFPLKASGISSYPMAGGFVGAGGDNGNTPFMYYNPADPPSVVTGYQVRGAATSFTANVVLVNKSPKAQSVTVNYELEYIPGIVGKNVRSALVSASVMPNSNGKSRSSVLTWEDDGIFLYGKGHLHDGGKSMTMWFYNAGANVKTAKPYYTCESVATYSGNAIVGMKSCNSQKVKKGDQVIMESEYTKEHGSNSAAGGNMAMFRMIFAS